MTRRFKSYSKHPPKIRTSPLPGADVTRNGVAGDHFVSDMSEPKRVKFTHPQATQVPKWDAPKTSEYAFFKKLKKDIGGPKSRPLHKEDICSKFTKANAETSTYSSTFKYSDGILRSSSRAEKEGPSNEFAFLSPTGLESNNLGIQEYASSGINQKSSPRSGYVVDFDQKLLPSPFAAEAMNLGNQYAEKEDVFSVKRQRLRNLAADLFPEARECNSKGFDLVSALISRLFPRSNETEYTSSKERTSDAEYNLLAFPRLDTLENTSAQNAYKIQDGSCWDDVCPKYQSCGTKAENSISKRRIIDAEYPSSAFLKLDSSEKTSAKNASKFQEAFFWDDVFLKYQSGRPRDRVLSEWDMTTSYLPGIKYNAENDFHDEEAIYNCGVGGKNIHYLLPESESSFCVLFKNGRFANPDHLIQLNGFQAPNEPTREEAQTLLLGWDVKEDKGKNSYSSSGNSLGFACQQIMEDKHEEIKACSPSLLSNHSLGFLSRPHIHYNMERNREDDFAVAEADLFPLSLSLPPKHLNMGEDSDIVNHFENDYISPQQDPTRYISKVAGKKGDLEAFLLPKGLDIHLGWKCLPENDFLENYSSNYCIVQFLSKENLPSYAVEQDEETVLDYSPRERALASSDGALDICDWSSASFNVSLGKMMGHPLLLDYPDRDRTEGLTYFDNDGQWRSS